MDATDALDAALADDDGTDHTTTGPPSYISAYNPCASFGVTVDRIGCRPEHFCPLCHITTSSDLVDAGFINPFENRALLEEHCDASLTPREVSLRSFETDSVAMQRRNRGEAPPAKEKGKKRQKQSASPLEEALRTLRLQLSLAVRRKMDLSIAANTLHAFYNRYVRALVPPWYDPLEGVMRPQPEWTLGTICAHILGQTNDQSNFFFDQAQTLALRASFLAACKSVINPSGTIRGEDAKTMVDLGRAYDRHILDTERVQMLRQQRKERADKQVPKSMSVLRASASEHVKRRKEKDADIEQGSRRSKTVKMGRSEPVEATVEKPRETEHVVQPAFPSF